MPLQQQELCMRYLWILGFLFGFNTLQAQDSLRTDSVSKSVFATYYHKKFSGRKTSSGVRYHPKKFTAAHRNLPFGTEVEVTNPKNGKTVRVKINDRGPFVKKYAIDLSEAAAKALGIYRLGTAPVVMKYLRRP